MQAQNIVIVGGSQGIGFGILQRCVDSGASVTVISRTEGLLAGISGLRHIRADVTTDEISSDQLPEQIDGFVYCPGTINLGPLRAVTSESLHKDFEINVAAGVRCLQSALRGLKRSNNASVIFFGTVAATQGLTMHTSVAASKGAVESMVRALAAELAPSVRVNAIAPALTDTPLASKFLNSDDKRKSMSSKYPLKRVGTIDDIAAAAMYLLGPDSGWVTGQTLHVDGGMSSISG